MEDSIDWIPMRSSVRQRIWRLGLNSVKCLELETTESLAKVLDIDNSEAKKLLEKIQSFSIKALPDCLQPVSVFDLLQDPEQKSRISTGSRELNKILDGGVVLGRLTEFCGLPGIGKTQLCMQLCLNVQTPENLGGFSGMAVFIDTDGGVIWSRLLQMASSFIARMKNEVPEVSFDPNDVLRRIYYFRCLDHLELIATVHFLRDMIERGSGIKLIVVDSIATHFRYAFDNLAQRAKMLNSLTHLLTQLAVENHVAVVLTNQMTTRVALEGESKLVPALGISWGYACAVRVNFYWQDNVRMATVFKSPLMPESDAPFAIGSYGVGDVETSASISESQLSGKTLMPIMSSQLVEVGIGQVEEVEETSVTPTSDWPDDDLLLPPQLKNENPDQREP